METTPSESSSTPSTTVPKKKKQRLGWIEWIRGWMYIIYEMLFQRIMASHLQNPLSLPPINNLTCIVTGSTSGIGLQIARQLAESGAHVVMAVRNTKAAHDLIHKWQSEWTGLGLPLNIEVMELDLLSLESVSRFAEAWNARMGPLHVLINNAGIFSIRGPQKFSKDGHEEHMQVNHLAPALLSILLLPSLIRGSPSRIINVNSVMHYVGFVDTEDMNVVSGKRKYTSLVGYTGSKLAQVMFSSVLHRRLPAESGISVLCVSPGVVQTNVARDLPKIVQAGYHLIPYFIFNAQEGSRSALFSATDPQIPEYCELLKSDDWPVCAFISQDCRPTNPSEEAHNIDTAHEVWEKTLEMIGLPSDAIEKLIEGEDVRCRYGECQE
ncbi:dehydrogenase/reductase SDR family [Salix suchowensis]|nr:dehydrogenase/reductase SDR family [Salix suchowensis]